jgi:hypothetical protein
MSMCLHRAFPFAIVALTLLTASESRAQGVVENGDLHAGRLDQFPYQPNQETWQRMDACRLQAQKQYPN